MGDVARPSTRAGKRIPHDDLPVADLEGTGRERTGLKTVDLCQPGDVDQVTGRTQFGAPRCRETIKWQRIGLSEAELVTDLLAKARGLGLETTTHC